MRKIVIIASIILLFTYCKKEDTKVCGCEDPATELQWLNELIQKAETDTSGLFMGSIYYEVINMEELFFIMMELDSINGDIKHWLECDGEEVNFEFHEEPKNMKLNNLIYTNIK